MLSLLQLVLGELAESVSDGLLTGVAAVQVDHRGAFAVVAHAVVAEVSAQVLDEAVEQRGEVDRVTGGPLVVVAAGVGGGAVVADGP